MSESISELQLAQNLVGEGMYCSPIGMAWTAVIHKLAEVRARFLLPDDLVRNGINICDRSSQSKIYELLAKTLGVEADGIGLEIEHLLEQQIQADETAYLPSREYAQEALKRARLIIEKLEEMHQLV